MSNEAVRRRFQQVLRPLLAGAGFGVGIAALVSPDRSLQSLLIGIPVGLAIAALIMLGEQTFLQRLRRLRFFFFFLIKTIYYTTVILFVIFILLLIPAVAGEKLIASARGILIIILASLAVSAFINFTTMLRRMLGQNVLRDFFTGTYHRPLREARTIMFLDIVSSTTIAEKIGDLNFHVFLNDFYSDMTESILAHQGEIYKYVGDEVIVSWKNQSGFARQNCVRCFFAFKDAIEEKRDNYLRKFGFAPQFRAGIHYGEIIIGETGDLKREIAFLGDTVNTTARVQEACKTYNKNLIISGETLQRLELPEEFAVTRLGETKLRGKETLVSLFGVERAT
ncbi:MAG TPA: adenylate/guanylate cyclase domain-containing protein [Smithellaceae bacterium]|nr:adenylate/guanylate cyclase domain-containing protein [Smithellaceae bacterium]